MSARRVLGWTLGVLLTGLYLSAVVSALGNLWYMPQFASQLGLALTPTGWLWLGLGIAVPVIVYALALLAARRRTAGPRLISLACGLCVVAVWQLDVLHLVPQSSFFS